MCAYSNQASTAGQYVGIIGSVSRGHSGGKTNLFKKSPHFFPRLFDQRSQVEYR